MMKKSIALSLLLAFTSAAIAADKPAPFTWDNATVYFLLVDRFADSDARNNLSYERKADAAPGRGFMGGDLKGVTAKIRSGYFNELGVDAIWINPPVEQIHAPTDEGTGKSYGFHGYWTKDFTRVDRNLGIEVGLYELVEAAHQKGLRVLLDVVMNHTGPETAQDPSWGPNWVRNGPVCQFKDVASTVNCTLVKNLPDIRTDRNGAVPLPPALVAKWKKEGRYEDEVKSLDEFFKRTKYPRAPRYYLIKWQTDWVRKYGFDGFRADTVKHVEPGVWKELKKEASLAYEEWKQANPGRKVGDQPFYMTAEVYNYSINHGHKFDMGGGKTVDFFANGFDSMINFSMPVDAKGSYEQLFSGYAQALHGPLKGYSVLNYLSSHDDGAPFDAARAKPFETANKLLLAPGAAQIYYGDETARVLKVEGATGDANLRSFMNWDELANNAQRTGYRVGDVRKHWALLGQFRHAHPAIGAGQHRKLADQPYTFARTWEKDGVRDRVVVALDVPAGRAAAVSVAGVFEDGQTVVDHYTGKSAVVAGGKVQLPAAGQVVLLSAK